MKKVKRIQCPAVNPLCPNDLCTRRAGHAAGWHRLSTMVAPEDYSLMPMMRVGASRSQLIKRGQELADLMWPEEAEGA